MLFPIWLHAGTFTRVALLKEPLQVFPRLETSGALPRLQPVPRRGPQPRAKRQTLAPRLPHEPFAILVRNDQLNPCHANELCFQPQNV